METKERYYFFENVTPLGRLYTWASGAMSSRTVSRQQATIEINDLEATLTDISPNGSYVNGKKIEPNQSILLKDGDNIRFGKEHFIFNHKILKEGLLE